jgi:hypothetical protein
VRKEDVDVDVQVGVVVGLRDLEYELYCTPTGP